MTRHKLTHTDLAPNRKHSTLQILLLLIVTALLAVPALAQVSNNAREDSSMRSDEQAKDQEQPGQKRFTIPALNNLTFDNSGTVDAAKRMKESATSSMFTRKATHGSSTSTPQPDPDLSNFAVFVEAGVAVPHGDISTFLDPGFSFNAGLEYMITSQFSAVGMFGYQRFPTFFGDSTNLYQLSGNAKFYLVDESSNVRPFVNGGVGAYVTDSAQTHFGGNVGGGILYEVTPKFGIQGSYNFHAFSVGDVVRFSTIQGGVRFRF